MRVLCVCVFFFVLLRACVRACVCQRIYYNTSAVSNAQRIRKFIILKVDFSVPGYVNVCVVLFLSKCMLSASCGCVCVLPYLRVRACLGVCACVFMLACSRVCGMLAYGCVCALVCVRAFVWFCMLAGVLLCTCAYLRIRVHIHTYAHTPNHTHTQHTHTQHTHTHTHLTELNLHQL